MHLLLVLQVKYGSYLAEFLLEKGYYVVGLKRRTSIINTSRIDHIYDFHGKSFKLEYGDINDSFSLYQLLNKYKPDEIYNLAAQSHVKVSFEVPEETLDVVGMGTLKLLNAIREVVPKAKFYQASSSEMYGDNPEYPQNELTRMTPASPYACAKLLAHNLTRHYRVAYGLHASCGICFNMESPRRGETFVTRKITLAAAKIKLGLEKEIRLGNLQAKRDWSHTKDSVEAMWLMLQQKEPDDYVIATGETHTVKEFLETVFEEAGLDAKKHLIIDERYFRPHEVPHLEGDASKAKRVLGWEPKIKFKELAKLMYYADLEAIQKGIIK